MSEDNRFRQLLKVLFEHKSDLLQVPINKETKIPICGMMRGRDAVDCLCVSVGIVLLWAVTSASSSFCKGGILFKNQKMYLGQIFLLHRNKSKTISRSMKSLRVELRFSCPFMFYPLSVQFSYSFYQKLFQIMGESPGLVPLPLEILDAPLFF